MGFLAGIAIIGFLVYLVKAFVSIFKKNGTTKKNFGVAGVLFVLFVIFSSLSDAPADEATETKEADAAEEEKVEPEEKEEAESEEAEKEPEPEPEPASTEDITAVVKKDMTDQAFKDAKEDLNAEHTESVSIGNGNVGYVLKATDGFVVASTDGETIMDVHTFADMDEVNAFSEEQVAAAEEKATEDAKQARKDAMINLSGSGDTATDGIELQAGWAIFDGTHSNGSSNFAVELQDESGQNLELLVNTIGTYNGKTFAMIPSTGTYYLNVTADGSWNFDIHQTPPVERPDAPTTLTGSGDDVVFVNADSGNYKLSFTHAGESNFAVLLNGQNLLVNEIGQYKGSTRQPFQDNGMYAFVVTADGDWSIKMEK
ncbi:hypothetical protein [Halobacillus litoralis]|uniref:hypothetical protein n=1 Tax=Halobacillus litoralis TaxID=45668 RepID=UPI001CFD808D|nr:hypothetical protein [Halobacillus litoralis]